MSRTTALYLIIAGIVGMTLLITAIMLRRRQSLREFLEASTSTMVTGILLGLFSAALAIVLAPQSSVDPNGCPTPPYSSTLDVSGQTCPGLKIVNASFRVVNFRNAISPNTSLTQSAASLTDFSDADMQKSNFALSVMPGADFQRAQLFGATFASSMLLSSVFEGADASDANFSGACINSSNFDRARLVGANFSSASLTNVSLLEANLSGADLEGSNLSGADLTNALLSGANLTGAVYSSETRWPTGFVVGATLRRVEQVSKCGTS